MKTVLRTTRCLLWLCAAFAPLAHAADDALLQCAAMHDGSARLKCYDGIAASRAAAPAATEEHSSAAPQVSQPQPPSAADDEGFSQLISLPDGTAEGPEDRRSYLTSAWNLDGLDDPEHTHRLTPLRPYRKNYLIVRESHNPNTLPSSPAPGHTAATPMGLDDLETKFQLSVKAEIMRYRQFHVLGFQNFRLWGAYTQQSNWQSFNTRNSSPFRDTNYEPELIATFGTGQEQGFKLLNVGLVHQSNGQTLPQSRSWNRVYVQGGWEWDNNLSLLARGWWRIPEKAQQDDNPDIENYIGRADAVLRWDPNKNQSVSLLLRNNLRMGQNHGFMQLDWTTPVKLGKSAKLFAQITNGYGETLLDYNHRQLTYGLGISFKDW